MDKYNSNSSEIKYSEGNTSHRGDISLLRIMATLCVVMIHTCNTITNNLDAYPNIMQIQLKTLLAINCLANWGVPMFFMITGCLLLKKESEITYYKCIRKYVKRAIFALIVFGIPFSCLEILAETKAIILTSSKF